MCFVAATLSAGSVPFGPTQGGCSGEFGNAPDCSGPGAFVSMVTLKLMSLLSYGMRIYCTVGVSLGGDD